MKSVQMKLNSIVSYFILLVFLFGCTFENKKAPLSSVKQNDEDIEKLISVNKANMLFLDFWFGMTKVQYEKVNHQLKQKKIITEGFTFYTKEGRSTLALLFPIFVHDSLVKINLELQNEKVTETIKETGNSINYESIRNAPYILELYLSKYNVFNKKDLGDGKSEYSFIDNNKLIIIHFKSTLLTLNANSPESLLGLIAYDVELTEQHSIYDSEENKKERKKAIEKRRKENIYAEKHPVYKKRLVYSDFNISYTNYSYYLNEIKSSAKQSELKKGIQSQKEERYNKTIDSLRNRTLDDI